MGVALFPIMMGIKVTGLISVILVGITIFVTKAVLLSKLALVFSIGLLIAKFLYGGSHHGPEYYELDHNPSTTHPVYEYPSASGYSTSGSGYANYAAYGGYGTSGQGQESLSAESSGQYSVVAPSNSSSTSSSDTGSQQTSASKRREWSVRRKAQLLPTYIRVKEYTMEH